MSSINLLVQRTYWRCHWPHTIGSHPTYHRRVTITIRKLEQEILAAGASVCILTTKSGNPENTDIVGVHPNRHVIFLDNSVELPDFVSNDSLASYHLGFSISKAVQAKVSEFHPSIIHVTCPDLAALHVIHYARTHQLPLMGTYHSNIPDYMLFTPGMLWLKPILEGVFRHIYNFLQALYVPTPFIRKNLIDGQKFDRYDLFKLLLYNLSDPCSQNSSFSSSCFIINRITNVQVWGRGVDLEKFSPRHRSKSFREKLYVTDDVPIILFAGRLVHEKRPDIFAKVIHRLEAMKLRYHALIVGAGPCDTMVKDLPNTTCLGWLSGSQLCEAYASSDIFLFPSSVETFGNVTLEAAASGLPLVVEGGCSGHLVKDGINGFACNAGNDNDFFEATLKLVQDASLRSNFSLESLKISETMEQRNVCKKMVKNYTIVVDEFYDKYQGLHENRDEVYQNSDSFRGGTDPRPFGMSIIEFFFVHIFFRFLIILVNGSQCVSGIFKCTLLSKLCLRRSKNKKTECLDDYESLSIHQGSDHVPLLSDSSQDDALSVSNENEGKVNAKKSKKRGFSLAQVAISIGESRFAVNFAIFCLSIVLFIWRSYSYMKRFISYKLKGGESRRARTKSIDVENKPVRSSRRYSQSEAGNVSLKQRNRSPNSVVSFSLQ